MKYKYSYSVSKERARSREEREHECIIVRARDSIDRDHCWYGGD